MGQAKSTDAQRGSGSQGGGASPSVRRDGDPDADVRLKALQGELDQLSLEQALLDVEASSARVIDLTERLVEMREQLREVRLAHEALKLEYSQYRAEQERVRSSQAYRLAVRIWSIRNALGI